MKKLPGVVFGDENLAAGEPILPNRIFAKPFRLSFENRSNEITSIEVRSLEGLREVIRRRREGEVFEIDGYSIELQLWGVLAEYLGFLKEKPKSTSPLASGIQPISEGAAALTSDLSELFGGDDETGVQMLSEIRECLKVNRRDETQDSSDEGTYVKEDGVNLTSKGEERLADLVGEPLTELERAGYKAEELVAESDPEEIPEETSEESENELEEPSDKG